MKLRLTSIILSIFLLAGCTHPLHVKNLYEYRSPYISECSEAKIGLASSAGDYYEEYLSDMVACAMEKYGVNLTYPYDYESEDGEGIDYFVLLDIQSEYKGSGLNFFINFPGFLLWTPKWHGYKYEAHYNVYAKVMNMATLEMVDEFNIPIELNMRHSEIDRTWVEISWLEWGVIAFIGGIYSIRYDEDVTPVLMDTCGNQLADYIAAHVLQSVKE